MWDAVTAIATTIIALSTGLVVGYRVAARRLTVWYVRPHTADTMAEMPLPEQQPDHQILTSQVRFRR